MAVLIAVATLACRDGPVIPLRVATPDLPAGRALWEASGLHTYEFTVQMSCFCVNVHPVRAYVINDSIVGGVDLTDSKREIDPRSLLTIPRLFDFVDSAVHNGAAVINATYDPELGFPSLIVYDGRAGVADDEVTYHVSDVKPIRFAPLRQRRAYAFR